MINLIGCALIITSASNQNEIYTFGLVTFAKRKMALFKTLQFILNHPLTKHDKWQTVIRYAKWQLYFKVNPHPVLHPFVENTRLIASKGLTGAVFNIYTGLHEFEDMAFMMHTLRPEDTFVDVGANIGSYTILAAGVVGCKTIAIEPIPRTFEILRQHIYLNNIDSLVTLHNLGIGSENGSLKFTRSLDTINHVATDHERDVVEVRIEKLDDLINKPPMMIKIDVEGFEKEVLQGSNRILTEHGLKAIIIELNGSGKRYGYSDEEIHNHLSTLGFHPFKYEVFERRLVPMEHYGEHNTIYIRDIEAIEHRIKSARPISILNKKL